LQYANACVPIVATFEDEKLVKLVQLRNVYGCIMVTPVPTDADLRRLHEQNALCPIDVTEFGSVMPVRFWQFSNAFVPIDCRPDDMKAPFNPLFENAYAPIERIEEPILHKDVVSAVVL